MNEPGASIAGLKLALTLLLTTRGIPMIYTGDEIAMPGGADPDNRRDFPGGWPGDPRNTFEASGRASDEHAVYEHVRRLAHLHEEFVPLRRGTLVDLAVGDQTYAYARVTERASAIIIFNNDTKPATVKCEVKAGGTTGRGRNLERPPGHRTCPESGEGNNCRHAARPVSKYVRRAST
jgi:neopullulanase